MRSLLQDVRHGLRVLWKSPGFAAVAVVTLALGIGANTAIFSLLDQVLLRRLPVPNPEQLVVLRLQGSYTGRVWADGDPAESIPYPVYAGLRDNNNSVFSGLLGRFAVNLSVAFRGSTERAQGELVSGNYFQVLGVRPLLGRVFSPEDDRVLGGHPLAVLSYGYWMSHLGGDRAILNQSILVNDIPMTIVGVTQPGFAGIQVGQTPDLFVPLTMKAQMTPHWDGMTDWNDYWLAVIGRLKPGVSIAQAEAALAPAFHPLVEEQLAHLPDYPAKSREKFLQKKAQLEPGSRGRLIFQRDAQSPLVALSVMAGLVLLIACANVANLLLARGMARHREFAVRAAMGASRARLLRQLTVESLLVGVFGGLLGLAVAAWTGRILISTVSAATETHGLNPGLDWRVLGFALAVSLFSALLFGLLPALRLSRTDLLSALKIQGTTTSAAIPQVRMRKMLVAIQVAFTVLLLAGGGLFARTLWNLRRVDVGIPLGQLITFSIEPQLNGYSTERTTALCDQLRERIGALPGVNAVAAAEIPILVGSNSSSNITVPGVEKLPNDQQGSNVNWISPGYFSALGVPLTAGREFTAADGATAPKVAIVSQAMAKRFYPNQDPIGRTFKWGAKAMETLIVGVVRDMSQDHVRSALVPFIYVPYAQDQKLGVMAFYIRTAQDPALVAPALRREVQQLDANLPIFQVATMNQVVDEDLFAERIIATLSACFAFLAALLAALGIYGVLAYLVAQRTREIGIRMVLGAEHSHVRWMVLSELGWMFALGALAGLPAAYGLARLSESLLYGVHAADPVVYAVDAALVALVALAASSLPMRRALRVAPIIALRHE
ncbi:MAG TPA: ABC transporter permease [Candidatus Acidoferrales bacterium]|nr:ABC transporter permease [Candidatus Acidoferrales bacterium]